MDDLCVDGWDAANIRISSNNGTSWELLADPSYIYNFDCGYGWIRNDSEYDAGGSLNHLAKGWGGNSNGWQDFNADLSSYAGKIKVAAVRCFPEKHYDYEGVNSLGLTVAIRKELMPAERAAPLPDQHGIVMWSIFI